MEDKFYINYSADLGKIYISGMICDDMASQFSEIIDSLLATQEHLLNPQAITIEINSGGGYATSMFAMVDTILEARKSIIINTHVKGQASSSAFIIWIVGNERTITKNSYVMWHDISYGLYSASTEGHRESLAHTDLLRRMANDIISSNTNLTRKQLQSIYKSKADKYYFSEEALKILTSF